MSGGVNGPRPRVDVNHLSPTERSPKRSKVDQKLQEVAAKALENFFKTAKTADTYQKKYENLTHTPVRNKNFLGRLFKKRQKPPSAQDIATAKGIADGASAALPEMADKALKAQLALVKHGKSAYNPVSTMFKITPLLGSSHERYLTPSLPQQRVNLQSFAPLILDLMASKKINIWDCSPKDMGTFLSDLARSHTSDEMPASLATAIGGTRQADGSVTFIPEQLDEILLYLESQEAFSARVFTEGDSSTAAPTKANKSAKPPASPAMMPQRVSQQNTEAVTDFDSFYNQPLSHMTAAIKAMHSCKAVLSMLTEGLHNAPATDTKKSVDTSNLEAERDQLRADMDNRREVLEANKGNFSLEQEIQEELEGMQEELDVLNEKLSTTQTSSQKPIAVQIREVMEEMQEIKAYFDDQLSSLNKGMFLGPDNPKVDEMKLDLIDEMDEAYGS